MEVTKVYLASPRGFCAGVVKAINALTWMVRVFPPPIYCYHEIVHNRLVVEAFEAAGVIFVDSLEEVPGGSPIMLSAHGSAPEVTEAARRLGAIVIDAVCPLVTKVHHEIKTRAQRGYTILYVGHRGHEEAIGATAEAPQSILLVETADEFDRLDRIDGPVALLTQTTLAVSDWEQIAGRAERVYPSLWKPARLDLCYATTNRQGAVKSLAETADSLVVIGSANSSNTRALERVGRELGIARVLRVNSATELPDDLAGIVAVTAGASAPESVVADVVAALNPSDGVAEVATVEEDEYFPPPPELRELLSGLNAAASLLFNTKVERVRFREESAADSLAWLVSGSTRR